ncbi:MAG TPA: NADPH-dependent FMN reductase [Pseudogracilibacillus sp.]|nr:NADPH-dependent FMN reductase [Pseudogracilibacillus sp.]
MKVVAIAGSIVGSTTKTVMEKVIDMFADQYPQHEISLLDLGKFDIQFSDGRNYVDYEGETKEAAEMIMNADALIIGTPIFQSSIPGTLKNVFDLLPVDAFRDKTVSTVVTAGSAKHYLVAEQQLKPILSYMKANLVPTYVFVEEQDVFQKEIINDDIPFRIERLLQDTVMMTDSFREMREKIEAQYDF